MFLSHSLMYMIFWKKNNMATNFNTAVVILNWNNATDTLECLNSLLESSVNFYSCIICDNGSSDNSIEKIECWLKENTTDHLIIDNSDSYKKTELNEFVLLRNDSNLGYAGGNNTGISLSLMDPNVNFVWVLNNDTIIKNDPLTPILNCFEDEPKLGLCGSILLDTSGLIQAAAGKYDPVFATSKRFLAGVGLTEFKNNDLLVENSLFPVGASLVFSRDVLVKIGLFDESYFLYFEELDYIKRMEGIFGFSICANSYVIHKGGSSTNSGLSEIPFYYSIKNKLVFTERYYKHYLHSVLFKISIHFLAKVFKLECSKAKIIFNAVSDFIRGK